MICWPTFFSSRSRPSLLLITISLLAVMVSKSAVASNSAEHQVITRKAALNEATGPTTHFNGHAVFTRFPVMSTQGPVAPATVTFEAGAMTNWHSHRNGRYLIVVAGEGRTQEWGESVQVIRTGDVVWCPPGVKHWHGGGEHTTMTHVAISPVAEDGPSVTWLEPVQQSKTLPTLANNELVATETGANAPALLSPRQLAIVPIAAFNATGDLERLKPALEEGLESGLTINDTKELLSHQYAYVGFPRSLNGLTTLEALLKERQKAGKKEVVGDDPSSRSANTDYYELGTKTLMQLTRGPANRPMFEFAPAMDYALKAHLFGYLFSRDNFNYIDRELTTIATLAAVGNVNSQLISHFRVAGNLGLTRPQLNQVIVTLKSKVNPAIANNAAQQLATLDQ